MTFLNDTIQLLESLENYKTQSQQAKKPVLVQTKLSELIENMNLNQFIKEGGLVGNNLESFVKTYLHSTTRLHHPGYLSHQVAVPHESGSQAALIDAYINNPMAIYEMGPSAAAIEYFIINLFLEKIGWTPAPMDLSKYGQSFHGGGVLTDGGSLANLTGLIAARSHVVPDVWNSGNPNNLAVIVPAASHYSNKRAAGILGIGGNSVYEAEMDSNGVMMPEKLANLVKQIENEGKVLMSLTANGCSTGFGLYDPLSEIGEFCNESKIWFHIDGAHGASVLFSKQLKHLFKGAEKADSISWDAHKLLRVPPLCTAILFKNHQHSDRAFQQEASYLFHEKNQPGFDFIHRTVECTKSALGLKVFMVLAAKGEKGTEDYLNKIHQTTLKAFDYIEDQSDFIIPVRPQSNILCFRYEESDVDHLKLRDKINANGNFYLSTTEHENKRYLRIVLMNKLTTLDHIKKLIDEVRETIQKDNWYL
jgi:L-2,4-diaminobutyrate decarboxylase